MRYDTTLAEDVVDLIEAIQRLGVDTEQIDALTVSAHNPGADGAVVDVVLTEKSGARAATFYDVDTDGRRSLAGALVNHSAAEQAEFATSRLRWLANRTPSTTKEPTE